jgi:phosphoenolpyruvate carboxykinase (ATP)
LVNTGWTGGPYGTGHRMPIEHTRALLNAALDGSLAEVEYEEDPIFGLQVPTSCPGVPAEVLRPRDTWSDPAAYDAKARDLAERFHANFEQFADSSSDEIKNAGPKKV